MDRMISEMMPVCEAFNLPEAVIPEAYLPYVPPTWNGILVLAEAQNLSKGNSAYREKLKTAIAEERRLRLYHPNEKGCRGVGPWDDGMLRLAVRIMGHDPERTAVGNAVPWSRCDANDANLNPDKGSMIQASQFWEQLFNAGGLRPSRIITCGKVADLVMGPVCARIGAQHHALRSSSTSHLDRVRGLFDIADLERRYPEVAMAIHDEWPERGNDRMHHQRLFFGAHVRSLLSGL